MSVSLNFFRAANAARVNAVLLTYLPDDIVIQFVTYKLLKSTNFMISSLIK